MSHSECHSERSRGISYATIRYRHCEELQLRGLLMPYALYAILWQSTFVKKKLYDTLFTPNNVRKTVVDPHVGA